MLGSLGLSNRVVLGIAFVVGGLVLVWRRGGFRAHDATGSIAGTTLAAAGAVLVLSNGGVHAHALTPGAIGGSLLLVGGPWLWRLAHERDAERSARIRTEERADLAARVHDSVLQTLALIQRHADDPRRTAAYARRQERELRSWLAGEGPPRPSERLADALQAAAIDIEESHGTPVDAVVVGDAPLDERTEALVAATREALTNAAKFAADGGPVRLYAEIENGGAHVFVDDRGPGFDPDSIPKDRRGVRESIIGRMKRFGGRAEIRSEPGDGTEVELTIEDNSR